MNFKTKLATILICLLSLPGIISAAPVSPDTTDADNSNGIFTIYPSYTHQGNSNWIIHSTIPGTTIRDFVTVENLSDNEINLSLKYYEATEKDGSFKPNQTQDYEHIGKWFNIEQDTITLPPHSNEKIPFSFTIPQITRFDDFKGVIFAEYTTNPQDATNIPITTRIGVRTYISINNTPVDPILPTSTTNPFIILGSILILSAIIFFFYNKTKLYNVAAILLILFSLTIPSITTQAQILEVEITRGGYLLDGPKEINFKKIETSLDEKISTVDFRELNTKPYLEVQDQNGGTPFSISVTATQFTGEKGTISNKNLYIQNHDSKTPLIQLIEGSSEGVELNSSTDQYAPLNETQTIFDRLSGDEPGKWRIFPSLQLKIPPKTKSGVYTTHITFTII